MTSPIRTPDQRLRVFVSSTLQELADERAAGKEAIQRIRLTPVMFEMGARPHPPRDLYRAYLAQSDVFIGIYWRRYGWVAPQETISGLEDEYLLSGHMPRLIYIKQADTREERLAELLRRIQTEDQVSYRPFSDAVELKELIENDLALMLTERFAASSPATAADGMPAPPYDEAPPLSLPPVERGNLIGREAEVELVTELLQSPATGLITLTGPGGTGKTRLATHLANSLAPSFRDGVFYVSLAAVRSATDVVGTIVSTMQIPGSSDGEDPERLLLGFLRGRHALLVLDNFEQVIEAAENVQDLLATCPHLKVLTTSREPLRTRGEREVPVPPLSHHVRSAHDITPAMELFEERAREVRPAFVIDEDNRTVVAELCRRLDGLPLAIELAAARARVLSPEAIVGRLDNSLALLTGGKRDQPGRHQTLRATIEWSVDLLPPEERVFFRRLSIFAADFSEDAAAAVVASAELDALDGLTSLVEKNLLVRSETRGETRFHMLQTVRELALEHLAEAGEERAARLRHGEWVVQFLAAEHARLMDARTSQAAKERLALEVAGARRALRFTASPDGDPDLAWRLFFRFGAAVEFADANTAEVLASYELVRALPRSSNPVDAALALGVWSWARASAFDPDAAPDLEAACGVLADGGERELLPSIQAAWGMLLTMSDLPRALVILDGALTMARGVGQTALEPWALMTICYAQLQDGAIDEAQLRADELANIARRRNDEEPLAYARMMTARVSFARGDLHEARSLFAEAASLALICNSAWVRAIALCSLASVTLASGDDADARAILEEALLFSRTAGYVGADALCGSLALLLAREGERERALRVLDAVAAGVEDRTGYAPNVTDPSGALRAATRDARKLLGDPLPVDPAMVDFDLVIEAALGDRPRVS